MSDPPAAEPPAFPRAAPRGERRLDLRTKLFYGLGTVAYGVKENGFSYLLLLFYNQVVGLPARAVGLALLIALLFDAIIDPLIGEFSDTLRTPWGRRHPLMYAAALPLAIAYAAIWNPPQWGQRGRFAFLVVMAVTVRALTSLYEVPSAALAAEFSTGYDERSVLPSYRYFFAWAGGLGADLVEAAELKTGRRSEGLFFAASAFVNKAVSGFGILAASTIIEAVHLKAGATPASVPPEVVRHLALVYAPTAAGLCALAVALLFGYRITRASHADTVFRLAAEAERKG